MSNFIEVLVEGRLLGGHPMIYTRDVDFTTKLPKFKIDKVTPQNSMFMYIGIPKGVETDWKQTPWGLKIVQTGVAGWPNGEHSAPTFAWKVVDGDSTIPGKNGHSPSEREGAPGHWILKASTTLEPFCKCFHLGKYDPTQQIQDAKEIKAGDYCRVGLQVNGNGPVNQSPGVYLNPAKFELSRAGVEIQVSSGSSAAEIFGGAQPNVPANAEVNPAVSARITSTPAAPVEPIKTMTAAANGATYEQFKADPQWTDELMVAQGYLLITSSGVTPNPTPLVPGQ